MVRTLLTVLAALSCAWVAGCGTALREGSGVIKGAEGVYTEIKPVSGAKGDPVLGQYANFELGRITDDFGGKVPQVFFGNLKEAFASQLAKKKLPSGPGGKVLLVQGRIVYFELKGSALGLVLGDVEEVVADMELIDKATGRQVATAICVGRTTQRVNFGVRKKAQGLAKAMTEWISAYYPDEDRKRD